MFFLSLLHLDNSLSYVAILLFIIILYKTPGRHTKEIKNLDNPVPYDGVEYTIGFPLSRGCCHCLRQDDYSSALPLYTPEEIMSTDVEGTKNLLREAELWAATAAVHSIGRAGMAARPACPGGPQFPDTV